MLKILSDMRPAPGRLHRSESSILQSWLVFDAGWSYSAVISVLTERVFFPAGPREPSMLTRRPHLLPQAVERVNSTASPAPGGCLSLWKSFLVRRAVSSVRAPVGEGLRHSKRGLAMRRGLGLSTVAVRRYPLPRHDTGHIRLSLQHQTAAHDACPGTDPEIHVLDRRPRPSRLHHFMLWVALGFQPLTPRRRRVVDGPVKTGHTTPR